MDEYTSSVYTNQLKGTYAKAKANLSQGILQAVQIAKKTKMKANLKKRHEKYAQRGWFYYETRFAIAIYQEESSVATS